MNEDLKALIINTLSSLNIPIAYMKYEGNDNTYITFFEYIGQPRGYSDDEEIEVEHFIQLNIYFKNDVGDLIKNIMDLFAQQGFKRNYIKDLGFDDQTQRYWTALCVYYLESLN